MTTNLYIYKAKVRSIYDGDTIRVDIDCGFGIWRMDVLLRFYGIDTPEIRGEERPQGLISKDYVVERIPEGSDILIETLKDGTGKYGRYLAIIYYGDENTNLNEELVTEGLAERYMVD